MSKYTFLQESKGKGKRLEELVKGSLDYLRYEIESDFRAQFPEENGIMYFTYEIFPDHVIVRQGYYGERSETDKLKADEFFSVNFTKQGDVNIFQPREQWQVVEMTYQPKAMQESVWVMESASNGARKIRIEKLMTADMVNGNNRIYPAQVLRAAVDEMKTHLRESAGQGRLMLLGEIEHPGDKGTRRANLMETVIRWTDVNFDGVHMSASGLLATETEGGRHIQALEAIGIAPGGSIRGYGATESVDRGGRQVEKVTELHLTGIDIVTDASFKDSQTIIESTREPGAEGFTMNLLESLLALLKARPDLFKVNEAELRVMTESQLQALWKNVSEAMGVSPDKLDVTESLREMQRKAQAFDESQHANQVEAAIVEATKDLPYGSKNAMFVEGIRASKPQDAAHVKTLVEARRKEYDQLFAGQKLGAMGFNGGTSGPKEVIETVESPWGSNITAAHKISEAIRKISHAAPIDFSQDDDKLTRNQRFTKALLERFDTLYGSKLKRESQLFQEAELTTDLDLPYSVSRAIIAEAFPTLVASGIFDVGTQNAKVDQVWYETWSGESGYTASVTNDAVTGVEDTWVALAHKRLTPGTVVVQLANDTGTYVEGTDYVIDYENGQIMALVVGLAAALHVDYDYTAVREGEMSAIQRGKMTLASKTMEMLADRVATEISREAIVFSRSQLGYDAVGRTLSNLAKQLARLVDQGLIYKAIAAVTRIANNSGGSYTYDPTTIGTLVEYIGVAKVKVMNRYYTPTFILCSATNAERISHWDGFTAAGNRPGDDRMGNGFVGHLNGLPVYFSTEMSDAYILVGNAELVIHRVFQPSTIFGPFPSYSNGKLVAAEQYYVEQFNGSDAPVPEKGAYVAVSEAGS